MDISAALAADLAALTESLANPEVDLQTQLAALAADLGRAVASYTGMTITIAVDGHEISFTAGTAAVATSLTIPFTALGPAEAGSTLVIHAGTPGALVDLAADLSFALALDSDTLALDAAPRSRPTPVPSGLRGLDEYSRTNQAIGVLIAGGRTPEGAWAELRRLAELDGGRLHNAADAVLRSLTAGPGAADPPLL